ncbi:hypothetical protein Tco_0051767 [Tanacetum coccineum]
MYHFQTTHIEGSDEEIEALEGAPQSPGHAPPSPDYVLGLEHPPSSEYVPGPKEPEQAPLTPDYPLPDDASPAALSPGYIADSDPKEDPEEDPELDPADYPADGGDDDDDESFDDDDDDDEEEQEASKDDNEDEEEHLAPADSSAVPVDDHVPSAEDREAFETDESSPTPVPSPRRRKARMSVRPQTPISAAIEAHIVAVADALPSSPPPFLLTLLSSPLPQIPSPPLHVPSPPLPLPSPPTYASPTYAESPLGYRAAEIRLRVASPSTHHLSDIPSLPLLLPSTTHRDDLPEADMPLQKRARFTTPTVDYGFIDTMDASIRAAESRAMTTIGVVNKRVTDLATTQRQESHELQVRCEDAHDDRALLGAQVSLLIRERRYFHSMASSYEREPRERIKDEDRLTSHIQHKYDRFRELIRTVEAGPYDGPENAGSSSSIALGPYFHFVSLCTDHVKMPPKKRTATTTTTTPMIDAQIKELISQGVADALAERDADRSRMAMTTMIQELA